MDNTQPSWHLRVINYDITCSDLYGLLHSLHSFPAWHTCTIWSDANETLKAQNIGDAVREIRAKLAELPVSKADFAQVMGSIQALSEDLFNLTEQFANFEKTVYRMLEKDEEEEA